MGSGVCADKISQKLNNRLDNHRCICRFLGTAGRACLPASRSPGPRLAQMEWAHQGRIVGRRRGAQCDLRTDVRDWRGSGRSLTGVDSVHTCQKFPPHHCCATHAPLAPGDVGSCVAPRNNRWKAAQQG
ncbi:hypothetical protein BDZ94DRAFT_1053056 [Collybia nuda]|uniref:Uncharacterized protein n=1 Tax=Collybia nuda TaxID=64659 RepID=A0A9P5XYS3_9AGAR|nr:hypothetical protein BDZ94DRAFT_1053056 [Collybia nuda]